MKCIETAITINATKDQVWQILTNFKNYPNWNPFIKEIKGEPKFGETLTVTLQIEGKKPMVFKPKVLISNVNIEFKWKGKFFVKGLFDGEHYFKIIEQKDGTIKFIHGEKFSGILSGILTKLIVDDTRKGFEQMNEALKTIIEDN